MFDLQATVRVSKGTAVTIHSIEAPQAGDYVNSHIIETANCLIVVDAQLLLPYARFVRAYCDRLSKPIERVIITHLHPDHFMGLEAFADVPIFSSQITQWAAGQFGQAMIDFKRGSMGDRAELLAKTLVVPTGVLAPGPLVIDGVELGIRLVSNTEHAEILQIDLPAERAVITQDIVYNGVHPAVGDKNGEGARMFDGWIAAVEDLQARDIDMIFPGHGAPCGKEALPVLLDYLRFTKGLFESGETPDAFKAKVLARYPNLVGEELLDYSLFFLYYSPF
jgi:glyoxylase-like metal-dependent hydrolase (beta-lactamase superfamily II)